MVVWCLFVCVSPYLTAFALDTLQLAPLLDGLGQVYLAQWNLHLANLVVFGEPVKVEDREHKGLVHCVSIRHVLDRNGAKFLVF